LLSATTGLRIDVSGVAPVMVNGVAADLQRLVRNLAANASRHARSVVGVACATEADGRAVLRVWDDGAGISPADRERVFERFTRLDEARDRDRGGSGLGLSIVGTIAADHGGAVSITDTPPELLAGTPGPGPGALFTVVLGPAL
jgi:signal transduction histidine kinase